jgi:predicted metalloprotease with PDZ domain
MKRNVLPSALACSLAALLVVANVAAVRASGLAGVSQGANENSARARANTLSLLYTLSFPRPHTHLYEVAFAIGNVTTPQIDLVMPTWTPGSYLQREFARNVQEFAAHDGSGRPLKWEKADKATWRVDTGGSAGAPRTVSVTYRVYANELSVRTSHLDATHAYFNGASVFMFVRGATGQPLKLKINAPAGWRVTTPLALAPDPDGFYAAPNYDILVDSPTEVGTHRLLEFDVRGKRHRIAIWGEGNYDEARLKEDFAKVVEQGALIFGGLPYEHYTFIAHVQPGIGGGLEHLNSTTLHTRPDAFRPRKNYVGFLGLVSHEYFHLWNVKRIRPESLGPFDYEHENYTRALWVSEGVTDYYKGQLLRRAGLMTPAKYLAGVASEVSQYEQTPGRKIMSAEESSFNAWIKGYRPDENTPNSAIDYYNKGNLLGWLLDFEIRARTGGKKTLDDVMRYLYENYAMRGVGFPESELKGAFEKVAGSDLTDFFARYVSGMADIDFDRYLRMAGLQLHRRYRRSPLFEAGQKDQQAPRGYLGVRTRANGDRVFVSGVLEGTPGYDAGVNTEDELVAIDGQRVDAANVNDRMDLLRPGQRVAVTVFRRGRIMTLEMKAGQKPFDRYVISAVKEPTAAQRAFYRAWLRADLKAEQEDADDEKEDDR